MNQEFWDQVNKLVEPLTEEEIFEVMEELTQHIDLPSVRVKFATLGADE